MHPPASPAVAVNAAGPGAFPPVCIAGRDFGWSEISQWKGWLARNSRGEVSGDADDIPEAVRRILEQQPDPQRLSADPSYARNYLGRPETPEEILEYFARNGFLPPAPSPTEEDRIKLVRKYALDDPATVSAVSDVCALARAFFPDDVTVVSTAVTEDLTFLTGISRGPHDDKDWAKLLETLEASWCMCRHGLAAEDDQFVVLDAAEDWRVRHNPLFRPEGGELRFYASVRVSLPAGPATADLPRRMVPVGNICAISREPHAEVSNAQMTALHTLAKRVERDLLSAHEKEQQRKSREQAAFISSFLQLTLGGSSVSSDKVSASMQAVFGGAGTTSAASRNDTAAFGLAAERICALSSATSATILDLRAFLPAKQSDSTADDSHRSAKRPRVFFHSQTADGLNYDIDSGGNPLVVLGHSGVSNAAIRRLSKLSKVDIEHFERLIRRLKDGASPSLSLRGTCLQHLLPSHSPTSHLVPIFDHSGSLALLIVVSLHDSPEDLIDGDQSFLENVGHVCLSSLIKDQDAESDRARLAFVSSISHALRLPLHGLAGQLELIRGASRDLDEYLQVADVCMDSLRSTLQDAIDFYDLSDHLSVSAFSTSTVELVDLAALLQDVTTRALNRSVQVAFEADDESGVRAKPVRVILDVAARDQGWLVRANAGDLRRMVANVVANAYTYTNEGEVRVSLQPTGETVNGQQVVKISVKDTGVGMDESFLQSGQLFIPFRRADAFTPSAGLGLPIVNLLVAQYGGQIHVTSARGRGTTVDLILPLSLVDGAPAPPFNRSLSEELSLVTRAYTRAAQHAQPDGITSPLLGCTSSTGYEFRSAVDGQKGVDIFREGDFRPDVTVMDIGMPIKDGISASHEIREIEQERGWPRHKIIALTGLSNEVDRVKAKGTIDDWLLKGGNSLRVLTEELARLQLVIGADDDGEVVKASAPSDPSAPSLAQKAAQTDSYIATSPAVLSDNT
ncbi:hypothetical protein Rhopal_000247-T1 [Rhodotorula paludigena]|uniref:histidine kinase n=1 Tax=Rhodotorula paludigena TaxID=86838 RepID=A0AAV5GBS7_9BASI|nr:hypothetical protein Rhopal_000247-T1 [Rhodotorula paludigena]